MIPTTEFAEWFPQVHGIDHKDHIWYIWSNMVKYDQMIMQKRDS